MTHDLTGGGRGERKHARTRALPAARAALPGPAIVFFSLWFFVRFFFCSYSAPSNPPPRPRFPESELNGTFLPGGASYRPLLRSDGARGRRGGLREPEGTGRGKESGAVTSRQRPLVGWEERVAGAGYGVKGRAKRGARWTGSAAGSKGWRKERLRAGARPKG